MRAVPTKRREGSLNSRHVVSIVRRKLPFVRYGGNEKVSFDISFALAARANAQQIQRLADLITSTASAQTGAETQNDGERGFEPAVNVTCVPAPISKYPPVATRWRASQIKRPPLAERPSD
jgi:hypothetical protein